MYLESFQSIGCWADFVPLVELADAQRRKWYLFYL
jgi:hypothetical protein